MMIVTTAPSEGPLPPGTEVAYERTSCTCDILDEKFLVKDRNFARQYAHIYTSRLKQLRPRLEERAAQLWGDVPIKKLFELDEDTGSCVVIGTMVKNQQLRPSILKEISEEHSLEPPAPREWFVHESDTVVLEDELQRIRLVGQINPHVLVTGIVCAVLGKEEEGGKFTVKDICYPSVQQQVERPVPETDSFVVLVSGLGFSTTADIFPLQLLTDILTGELGTPEEQEKLSKVVRVIIAGNSIAASTQNKDSVKKARYLTRDSEAGTVEAVRELDNLLDQLVATVDVDLMPGEFDPSNHLLPQQPLHPCMFAKAGRYATLHSVTNPHHCIVGGCQLIGTSGQNIHDIHRYSQLEDPLEVLERLLEWGHMAPTAPDTLNCYPFYSDDPFLMNCCPDVFFAGNQKKFATRIYQGAEGQSVRLLSLPSFAKSSTAVLLNLRTLDCQPLTVQTSLASEASEDVDK